MTVVNVNPLYTPRELQHQLADSGAKAIVVLENFAHTLQQALDKTPVPHVVVTRIGDLLSFPMSLAANLAVKYLKRMVPAWSIPQAIDLPRALRARQAAAGRGLGHRRRHRLSAVHRRHDRRPQRAPS